MKSKGMGYVHDIWNIADLLQICVYFFMVARADQGQDVLFKSSEMYFFRCLMIFLMYVKIHDLLRVTEQFGHLVSLILQCLLDLMTFLIYWAMWILFFVCQFMILQLVSNNGLASKDKGSFRNILLYTFESSVANLHDFRYPHCASEIQNTLLLLTWIFQQMIMVIVMLNFLISVISQSYEQVMNNKEIKKFDNLTSLNMEVYQFLAQFSFLRGSANNDLILISLPAESIESSG